MTMNAIWNSFTRNPFTTTGNSQHAFGTDGSEIYYTRYDDSTSLLFASSVDEGFNFGSEVTVASTGVGAVPLDQPICKDPVSGRLFVFYGRSFDSVGNAAVLAVRYSDDDGATWSSETVVDDGTSYTNTNGRFYRMCAVARNRTIVLIISSEDQSLFQAPTLKQRIGTWTGTGSVTWGSVTTPWSGVVEGDGSGQGRPTMWDDGASLHVTWEDSAVGLNGSSGGVTGGGSIWYSKSNNLGSSWSTQRVGTIANLDGTYGGGRPVVTSGRGSVVILTMAPFGNGKGSDIYMIRSTDSGSSFAAPTRIATNPHGDPSGYSHPIMSRKGSNIQVIWCDAGASPSVLKGIYSTDAGASWGSVTNISNYTSQQSDAAWIVCTNHGFMAALADSGDSNKVKTNRFPIFSSIPDSTRIIDTPSGTAGPPPDALWTGTLVNGAGTAGEGLVTASSLIKRKSSGSSRQGSYLVTQPSSADFEILLKFSTPPTSGNSDTMSLYMRTANPNTGTMTAYEFKYNPAVGNPWQLNRFAGGSYQTTPILTTGPTISTNHWLGGQHIGFIHRLWYSTDGSNWELVGNVNEGVITANGYAGVEIFGTAIAISLVAGGVAADPVIDTSLGTMIAKGFGGIT